MSSIGAISLRNLSRTLRVAAVLLGSTALFGCGMLSSESPAPPAHEPVGQNGIGTYLDTMQKLANGEPSEQAVVFYSVEHAYADAPTTANTLRRAVALVTPGHPATNLVEGKKLLEQLLATPERLVPAERDLAAFLVKDADTRLQLQADIRRLSATVDERSHSQANSDRRAQAQQEEINRLRRALDEAQHKLDAIKSIERSIIERSVPPATGREPSSRN